MAHTTVPVGRIIHHRRRQLGLTQQQVASLLWRTQQWVSLIEQGKRTIQNLDDLRYVADRMGIPPEQFGLLPLGSPDPAGPATTPAFLAVPAVAAPVLAEVA